MHIKTKDGDTISIVVELEASANDPALEIPAVAQSYRVIANSYGPTLELVALAPNPVCLSEAAMKR